jgi:hypothetical protein
MNENAFCASAGLPTEDEHLFPGGKLQIALDVGARLARCKSCFTVDQLRGRVRDEIRVLGGSLLRTFAVLVAATSEAVSAVEKHAREGVIPLRATCDWEVRGDARYGMRGMREFYCVPTIH